MGENKCKHHQPTRTYSYFRYRFMGSDRKSAPIRNIRLWRRTDQETKVNKGIKKEIETFKLKTRIK